MGISYMRWSACARKWLLGLMGAALFTLPAWPQRLFLNVDFAANPASPKTGMAVIGNGPNDYWNDFSTPASGNAGEKMLNWSDGSPSPASVNFFSEVTFPLTNGTNSASDPMFQNFMTRTDGGPFTGRIHHLPPGTYDLFLYGHFGENNSGTTFSVQAGATRYPAEKTDYNFGSGPLEWSEGAQYVRVPGVVVDDNPAFQIPITIIIRSNEMAADPGGPVRGHAAISGIQIMESCQPGRIERHNVTARLGDTLTLAPPSFGNATHFEWRHGSSLIPGASSNSFTFQAASLEQAGVYSISFTNSYCVETHSFNITMQTLTSATLPVLTLDVPAGSQWEIQYLNTPGDLGQWITLTNLTVPTRPYSLNDTIPKPSGIRRYYRALNLAP